MGLIDSLSDFYDAIPPALRKWLFIGVVGLGIYIAGVNVLAARTVVASHVEEVGGIKTRVTRLEVRQDSIIGKSNDNWDKLSRFVCFENRTAAILSGYDCNSK